MEPERIDVYSHAMNSCVVKMPERQFPGVVIQGDSLSALLDRALEIVEKLDGTPDEDAFLSALEVAKVLESHLLNYEETLKQHGIDLPYSRDPSRNTKRFLKRWDEQPA